MTCRMLLTLLLLLTLPGFGADATLKPLDGALWKGSIQMNVVGPLYTQYIENKSNDQGHIVGFIKEKGHMKVDLQVEIQFVVNALGEFEMVAKESFQGDYYLNRLYRYAFNKEMVSKDRLRYRQKVQVSNIKITQVHFEAQSSYERESFSVGSFRLLPSGKLDKKGSLHVAGEFKFDYEGKGSVIETKEHQPPQVDSSNSKTQGDVKKSFSLPISFDFNVALNHKPTSGELVFLCDVKDPFPKADDRTKSHVFKNSIKLKGSYQLTPMFGKKRKRK